MIYMCIADFLLLQISFSLTSVLGIILPRIPLQTPRTQEPISGPPAWRFSVSLARVRAKAKETRLAG